MTTEVLHHQGGTYPGTVHVATLAGADRADLDAETPLALRVTLNYRLIEHSGPQGPWKVETVAYEYALEDDEKEILAYHWHPNARGSYQRPHLHARHAFDRRHLPTGRVALEDVIRSAIQEFGVHPRRDDWAAVLDRAQLAFEQWRTWG